MRGTRSNLQWCWGEFRFIPAGAGNAPSATFCWAGTPVHPRRCGERTKEEAGRVLSAGSSPQVRGTHQGTHHVHNQTRFIPAGAGNAFRRCHPGGCGSVHPRRCGERLRTAMAPDSRSGSSPQVRGTPSRSNEHHRVIRFIPAGAGNAHSAFGGPLAGAVHPRRCGERMVASSSPRVQSGSSPQVRGTHVIAGEEYTAQRFIPAGAGNAQCGQRLPPGSPVHPRRCGERLSASSVNGELVGSSPQVRGTRVNGSNNGHLYRFIPAGAGNAHSEPRWPHLVAVHPRRCGERFWATRSIPPASGSSPQVRGTLILPAL